MCVIQVILAKFNLLLLSFKITELSTVFVTSSDISVLTSFKLNSLVRISITVIITELHKSRYNHKSSPLIGKCQFRASLVEMNRDINGLRKSRG